MSKKRSEIFWLTFGIALIGGIIFLFVMSLVAVGNFIRSINSPVAMAIIAGTTTLIVSVLTLVLGKIYAHREQVIQEHRKNKIPVYEEFIKFMTNLMSNEAMGLKPSEKELGEFMVSFTQRLMIWGSDSVLVNWVNLRRFIVTVGAIQSQPTQFMLLYEKVILSIRKDLGHKNSHIKEGDILVLFINDIDLYLSARSLPTDLKKN
jgi:uncharacterized protein YneF (UPF0154 family)